MWSHGTLKIYDMLTEVVVVANVYQSENGLELSDPRPFYRAATQFPGSGEENPAEWLKDALIALIETL